jgi:hypothetical protein
MENRNSQLQQLSTDKFESLLIPIINKLDIIEKKLNKKSNTQNVSYYRNKDLKDNFGLSPNTIIKYRETGLIPYTTIGDIYLYPIKLINEILKENSNWILFQNKAS